MLRDDAALPQARADLAHKLKGSARTVGAFGLAKAAEAVETGLRAGDATPRALDAPCRCHRSRVARPYSQYLGELPSERHFHNLGAIAAPQS